MYFKCLTVRFVISKFSPFLYYCADHFTLLSRCPKNKGKVGKEEEEEGKEEEEEEGEEAKSGNGQVKGGRASQ